MFLVWENTVKGRFFDSYKYLGIIFICMYLIGCGSTHYWTKPIPLIVEKGDENSARKFVGRWVGHITGGAYNASNPEAYKEYVIFELNGKFFIEVYDGLSRTQRYYGNDGFKIQNDTLFISSNICEPTMKFIDKDRLEYRCDNLAHKFFGIYTRVSEDYVVTPGVPINANASAEYQQNIINNTNAVVGAIQAGTSQSGTNIQLANANLSQALIELSNLQNNQNSNTANENLVIINGLLNSTRMLHETNPTPQSAQLISTLEQMWDIYAPAEHNTNAIKNNQIGNQSNSVKSDVVAAPNRSSCIVRDKTNDIGIMTTLKNTCGSYLAVWVCHASSKSQCQTGTGLLYVKPYSENTHADQDKDTLPMWVYACENKIDTGDNNDECQKGMKEYFR